VCVGAHESKGWQQQQWCQGDIGGMLARSGGGGSGGVVWRAISKKEPACTSTYYALLCLTGTHKAFVRKFSVRSVSQVNVLQ
jgi:hypothetical protein